MNNKRIIIGNVSGNYFGYKQFVRNRNAQLILGTDISGSLKLKNILGYNNIRINLLNLSMPGLTKIGEKR